jgi:hypothetical protein
MERRIDGAAPDPGVLRCALLKTIAKDLERRSWRSHNGPIDVQQCGMSLQEDPRLVVVLSDLNRKGLLRKTFHWLSLDRDWEPKWL